MSKFMKKIFICFMMTVFVIPNIQNVSAATKYGEYKKVSTKKTSNKKTSKKTSKLKKNYKSKKTIIYTKTVKKRATSYSPTADVVKDTTIKTETKNVYYKKKKTVYTTVTTTIITKTTNYIRSGNPSITVYKGVLPNKIITKYQKDGFKTKLKKNMDPTGLFSSSKKEILLKYNVDCAHLHEIGHYVDHKVKMTSKSAFKTAYAKEKSKYSTYNGYNFSYATSTIKEYFAEAFRDYYYSASARKQLKTRTPKTYKCIQDAINQF